MCGTPALITGVTDMTKRERRAAYLSERIERRSGQSAETERPLVGVGACTPELPPDQTPPTTPGAPTVEGAVDKSFVERDADRVHAQYRDALNRLDRLVGEANDIAGRFERLAQGLSRHPAGVIAGLPGTNFENAGEFEIVPFHSLPSIDQLAALTEHIREEGARVEELRERLILLGHADLVKQPNGFFH